MFKVQMIKVCLMSKIICLEMFLLVNVDVISPLLAFNKSIIIDIHAI